MNNFLTGNHTINKFGCDIKHCFEYRIKTLFISLKKSFLDGKQENEKFEKV